MYLPVVCCVVNDPFEHVGSVLVNITKTAGGRKIVSEPKRCILKQIIPQFDSASMLRKKGVCTCCLLSYIPKPDS